MIMTLFGPHPAAVCSLHSPPFSIEPAFRLRLSLKAFLCAATAGIACLAQPVAAQLPPATPLVQSATPVANAAPLDPEAAARLEAQRQLTEALARIAADSSDWMALSQAGRAALVLGDGRAALGFLGRAEALNSRDPTIKAAMGAAMVLLEDPQAAMRYFDAAVSAGGLDRLYLGDRGLAFDLLGNQVRAQADYAVAIQSHPSAELTRRYAISLGISGQTDQAIQMLGPLLRAQDRAAWRSRAMILAMNGRSEEARQIARATMPAQLAQGIDPYLSLMDRLTPVQLAFASHFGRFPAYDVVRAQPQRAAPVRVAAATPAPVAASNRNRGRERSGNRNRNSTENDPRPSTRNDRRSGRSGRPAAVTPTPAPTPAPVVVARADPAIPSLSSAPPPPSNAPVAARPVVPTVSQPIVQPVPASVAPSSPSVTPAPAPSTTIATASPPASVPAATAGPISAPATVAVSAPAATSPDVATTSVSTSAVGQLSLPASTVARSESAGVVGPVQGPPDIAGAGNSERPGFSSVPGSPPVVPAPVPVPVSVSAEEPATTPAAAAAAVEAPAPASAAAPPAAPATDTGTVIPGWSLDSVVQSLEVPEAERATAAPGLSLAEIQAIAAERRRQQEAEAAEARARARAQAEARAREQAEAQARQRAEAERQQRAEQERLRRQPARIWYQIATGSDPAALAFDCRRLQRQHAEAFGSQTCSTAVWNRTRRLLVGPFRSAAAAREWGAAYSRAGGGAGFVWNSDAGEEVTPVGRR